MPYGRGTQQLVASTGGLTFLWLLCVDLLDRYADMGKGKSNF